MLKKTTFFLTMTVLAEIYGRKLSDITLGYLYEGLPEGLTDDVWNYAVRKYIDSGERFFPSTGQLLDSITTEGDVRFFHEGMPIGGYGQDPVAGKQRVLTPNVCQMFRLDSNQLNPVEEGREGRIKEHGIWRNKARGELTRAEIDEYDERLHQVRLTELDEAQKRLRATSN